MRFLSLLLFLIASAAHAGPSFIASHVSDQAPCMVHFDATATTGGERPYHNLTYVWDFGDERGEFHENGYIPLSKNVGLGPIQGHTFEEPGEYEVTLTAGGSSVQQTVTCGERPASTTCFSNTTDFEGCPSGAARGMTSSFDTCDTPVCLYRNGQEFVQAQNLSSGGMYGGFGDGDRPHVTFTGSTAILSPKSHAVIDGIRWSGNIECQDRRFCSFVVTSANNVTLRNISADNVLACLRQGIHAPDLLGVEGFECKLNSISPGKAPTSVYVSGTRILWQNSVIDGNYLTGSEFNFRYSCSNDPGAECGKTLIAHSRFMRAAEQRNPLQLRGALQYLQIYNNHLSTRNARELIEVCERPGGCGNPDSDARDIIFELNLGTFEGGTDGQQNLFGFMASDVSARNNDVIAQGIAISTKTLAVCNNVPGFGARGNVRCTGNMIWFNRPPSGKTIVTYRGMNVGSGNVDQGNMISLCPGDLNGSGTVDEEDFNVMAPCMGSDSPGCRMADLNQTDTVNVTDFSFWLQMAKRGCPTAE